VDAPSCLCLDSGRSLMRGWDLPRARLTVTFDCLKAGHVLAEGPALCGRMAVVDIGITPWRQMEQPRRTAAGWSGTWKPVRLGLIAPDEALLRKPERLVRQVKGGVGGGAQGMAMRWEGRQGAGGLRGWRRGGRCGWARGGDGGLSGEALVENAARLDAVMLRVVADGRLGSGAGGWADRGGLPRAGAGDGGAGGAGLWRRLWTLRKGEVPPHLAKLPEAFQRPSLPAHPGRGAGCGCADDPVAGCGAVRGAA
jgi:hypothetical protein